MAQKSNNSPNGPDNFLGRLINGRWLWAIVIAIVVVAFSLSSLFAQGARQVDTNVGLQLLNDHQVKSAKIYDGDQRVELQLKEDYKQGSNNYGSSVKFYYVQPRAEEVVRAMNGAQLESYTDQPVENSFLGSLISLLLPVLLFGAIFWLLMGRMGGNSSVMSFAKSRAKKFNKDNPTVRFSDVAGVDEALAELEEVREFLAEPEKFTRLGAKIPKGVLLYGPPGCGKTLIAKAVATSLADSPSASGITGRPPAFLNIKGPELLSKFVGETERQIRAIFDQARKAAAEDRPVVIFFDEMEALFRTRGTGVSSDVETMIVPQVLAEIDGVESLRNVVIIGASNREDMIDPAILRPGRLDVKIRINRPDAAAAEEILARHLTANLPLDPAELAAHGGDREATAASLRRVVVEALYARNEATAVLEITEAHTVSGASTRVLHLADLTSGAMLAAIVSRAKTASIKDELAGGAGGLSAARLRSAVETEARQNEEITGATTPEGWARLIGTRTSQILSVRRLGKEST